MFNKNCLIPTPENHNTYHQQKFRNQDRSISNIGDQAALNADKRKKNLQTSLYARAAPTILEDMQTPPEWKWSAASYFQAINTRQMNMQRWVILDSGASSHFLIVSAPLLHKRKTANPIVVTVANGERVQSTHDGALDCHQAQGTHILFLASITHYCQVYDYAMLGARLCSADGD